MKKKLIKLETAGQLIRAHRRMWRWLSENPKMPKNAWPGWERNGGRHPPQFADCFLCSVAGGCQLCPLVWPDGECCVDTRKGRGLFSQWVKESFGTEERAKIAKRIAKLPVRR